MSPTKSLRIALVAAGCLLTLPCAAQSSAGEESVGREQPAAVPPTSARTKLVLVGAVTTIGAYGLGFATSGLWPSSPAVDQLRIPVAGSWMALPNSGCGANEAGCSTFPVVVRSMLTGLSAIGQAGGVALLMEALFMPTAADHAAEANPATRVVTRAAEPTWYASPVADQRGVGLLFGGTF